MKKCKHCGEIVSADTLFCDSCGKDVFVFSKDVACSVCGFVNDEQYTHCTNCGSALSSQLAPVDSLDTSTAVDVRTELSTNFGAVVDTNVKESAPCPNCGTEIQVNSVYCYRCGTPVTRLHENKVLSRKVCPQCNTPNLLSSPHCSYCYTSLDNAPIKEYQLTHETQTLGKTVVKRAILQGSEGRYHMCNSCGAINAHDEQFCVQCGLRLVLEENLRYCVNCGAENDGDALFCTGCQWSFEGVSPEQAQGVWICTDCEHVNSNNDVYCVQCGKPHEQDK